MKKYLKIIVIISIIILGTTRYYINSAKISFGAFSSSFKSIQVGSNPINGYILQTDGTNSTWVANSGGGGSGSGTWATTTSTHSGRLINYPLNTTDIVTIGSNATTSAEYYFDPNTLFAYLSGRVSLQYASTTQLDITGTAINSILSTNASGAIVATSTITANNIWATSTTLSNYFAGNVGIGTSTPGSKLDIAMTDGTASADRLSLRQYSSGDVGINFELPNVIGYRMGIDNSDSDKFKIGTSVDLGANNLLTLTSGGNFGIGTTSPIAEAGTKVLHVYDTTRAEVKVQSAAADSVAGIVLKNDIRDWHVNVNGTLNDAFQIWDDNASRTRLVIDTNGNVGIGTTTPTALLAVNAPAGQPSLMVGSSTATSFIVDKNGNVGVGTASPLGKLSLNSTAASENRIEFKHDDATKAYFGLDASSNDVRLYTWNGSSWSTPFAATTNGNVGIGTTSPRSNLHFDKAATGAVTALASALDRGFIISDSVATNAAIQIGIDGGNASYLQARTGYQASASANAFAINPLGGNVGIGTSTPAGKLQIAGTRPRFLISDSAAGTNLKHYSFDSQGGNLYMGVLNDALNATTTYMTMLAGGNIGVGSTTPGSLLSVGSTAGINFFDNATSTFGKGIDIRGGCFSINGACIGGSGGISSVSGTYPVVSSGGSTPSISLAFGTTTANSWSALQTFNYSSSTAYSSFSVASSTTAFIGTLTSSIITAVTKFVGVISSTFTPSTEGEIGIDTTSNQFKYFSNGAVRVVSPTLYSTFTYATSTSWTGTTTIPLGTAYVAETWTGVQCFTDTGTANISIYDGTNRMNMFNASTTVGTVALSTNNTWTAGEKRYVDIGTPASTPTKVSCTVAKTIDAD